MLSSDGWTNAVTPAAGVSVSENTMPPHRPVVKCKLLIESDTEGAVVVAIRLFPSASSTSTEVVNADIVGVAQIKFAVRQFS